MRQPKYLQTLTNVPWAAKPPFVEDYCSRVPPFHLREKTDVQMCHLGCPPGVAVSQPVSQPSGCVSLWDSHCNRIWLSGGRLRRVWPWNLILSPPVISHIFVFIHFFKFYLCLSVSLTSWRGTLGIFRCAALPSSLHEFQATIFSLADPGHGHHQLWSDYPCPFAWSLKGNCERLANFPV